MSHPIELRIALAHQADLRAEQRKLRFPFRRPEPRLAVDGHRPVALRPSAA
jgi:hypothetical protein